MDRTLTGRAAPSRLPWPFTNGFPLGGAGHPGRRRRAAGRRPRLPRPGAGSLRRLLADRRRLRILFLSMLAALPILAGGWLWLRDSSLVRVSEVRISGVHGADAPAIESALTTAARRMSTLDVRPAALIAAVAPFRVVRAVHVSASFPHAMQIEVVEQLPVAAVEIGGIRTAVAADGAVLGPALLSGSLPSASASSGGPLDEVTGQYLSPGMLLDELTVLGAEPAPFAKAVARVFSGPRGITVAMHNGLLVYFGDATLPHAKWLSLARVLLSPTSAGASYIDVRVPERPAAGFPGGVAPDSSATATTESSPAGIGPSSASEPTTTAELAAGLAAALGTSTGSPAAREAPTASQAQSQAATTPAVEPGSSQGPQSTAPVPSEATATGASGGG